MGKLDKGFFLMDAVLSILIISTAFIAILSFLLNAFSFVMKNETKVRQFIDQSNREAQTLYEKNIVQ